MSGLELIRQLRGTISDERVLAALASIPRERFVLPRDRERAYQNVALPIDCGQTISQPLVVARMLELLEISPTDRVLDVGTGSGYHAALISLLADHVWSIERHAELSAPARRTVEQLGLANVSFVVGDGGEGLPGEAPFDAINVAAAIGTRIPPALLAALGPGGRLLAPLGTARAQHLVLIRRARDGFIRREFEAVRFVPLIREQR